jgi:Fe2+ or Zn2+ uptake regulation protein
MNLEDLRSQVNSAKVLTIYERLDLLIKIESVTKLQFIEEAIDNLNKDFVSQSNDQFSILEDIRNTILNK